MHYIKLCKDNRLVLYANHPLNEGFVRPIHNAFAYGELFNLKPKSHRGEGDLLFSTVNLANASKLTYC